MPSPTFPLIPLLAAALLLAPRDVRAQTAFDMILPTSIDLAEYVPGVDNSLAFGAIVNTGTEPIPLVGAWVQDPELCGTTSTSWAPFSLDPGFVVAGPFDFELQPGGVLGSLSLEMEALLQPGESKQFDGGPLSIQTYETALPGSGPTQLEVVAALPLFDSGANGLSGIVRFQIEVDTSSPFSLGTYSGAQRVSATLEPTPSSVLGIGCTTSVIAFAMTEGTVNTKGLVDITRSINCRLPVLGNDAFGLRPESLFVQAFENDPWILTVAFPGNPFLDLLNCTVLNPAASLLVLDTGLFTSTGTGPFASADFEDTPLPIPANPMLAGATIDVQWALVSPASVNGVFAASLGRRLNLIAP